MVFVDVYSQPEAPDPVLDADQVLELARRHGLSVRRVTAVDESGGEARAYMCDDDIVVKAQRPHRLRPRTSLEKEAFILDQIGRAAVLPIPRLLGYGREGETEYLVMTRIRGVALETSSLTGSARVEVLEEIGATLRRIHDLDQTAMASSRLVPGDRSADDLAHRLSAMFENLISLLSADERWAAEMDLRAAADQCLAGLRADTVPVTLHSNPGPEHCFVDPESARFTGLIDFGDAYRSHPALDLRSWLSPEDSRHILSGYRALGPLSDGFEHVWRVGIILTELRLAARGTRQPGEVAGRIRELLSGAAN